MSLEMKDRAFWYQGSPHFFYGGEMHYFRLPASQWVIHLHRMRDLGLTTVSTYVPWLWHEPQPEQFDFAGHTHPQRNLLQFLSLAAEADLTVFLRPGPYVMAELRQEGLPGWLLTDNPDVLALDSDGQPHPTRLVSYLHPRFLQLVERWYGQLAAAVRPYFADQGGPILLTQLDNEVGMLHWVSAMPDHQIAVQEAHQDFLKNLPIRSVPAAYWRTAAFWRDYRARFLHNLAEMASAQGFPAPYVINVHGFRDFSIYSRGVDYPVGLSQLAGAAALPKALLGGDFYPGHLTYDNFHDVALAVAYTEAVNSPDAASFSPEFQSGRFQDRPHIDPSDLDLTARVSMAQGLNGLNWYMASAGENPEDIGAFGRSHDWQAPLALDGSYRPSAAIIRHLGTLIHDFGQSLAVSRPKPDLEIGYYSAYYMTENPVTMATEAEAKVLQAIVQERESFHFDGIYRLLVAANVALSAVWLDGPHAAIEPEQCPVLWVATTRYMDAHTQTRLADYAQAGGTLILGPTVPDHDLSGRPCHILADALDLPAPITSGHRGIAQILSWDSVYCPTYNTFPEVAGIEVFGRLKENGTAKEPVIVRQITHHGHVVVVGIGFSGIYDTYHKVVRDLLTALGRRPSLHSTNAALHVARREGPQGHFLFVNNLREIPQTSTVTATDGEKSSRSWSIAVGARQGLILPYGGVPLVSDRLNIAFTTVELTMDSLEHLRIHRGAPKGLTQIQWMGEHRPAVSLVSGTASIENHDHTISLHWDDDEAAMPIVVHWKWPKADTPIMARDQTHSPDIISAIKEAH